MLVAHVFLDDRDCEPMQAKRILDPRKDARPVERHLRCDDNVRRVPTLALSQCGRRGQPTGVPARDLDHGYRRGRSHRLGVSSCPLCRRGNEPSRAAVAGRMVRAHKVVVDGLGHEGALSDRGQSLSPPR